MATCDLCGNDYDKAFTVTLGGTTHTFDSFECAIHMLAPRCEHCECRSSVMGSRPAASTSAACTAPSHAGVHGLADRVRKAGERAGA